MRIEYLKFKNINSLKGEWHINFMEKEFIESGIFAIVGETGAGKSSILDAITLGLYGKSPRQKEITASKNNIMTKGTTECYSEVIFRGKDNKRYKSRWYQHRAKRRVDGKLQPPKVLLEELDTKTLATKIEEWREKIVDVTHLNFDRFCKCVMLAQGNFNAFLKAKEKEKSEILEQITDSTIYTNIGKRVYQETKEKRLEQNRLKEKLEITKPLPAEEKRDYQMLLKLLQQEVKLILFKLSNLRDQRNSLEKIENLQNRLNEIESSLIKSKEELNSITQGKIELEKLLKEAIENLIEFEERFNKEEQLISQVEKLDILIEEKLNLKEKYKNSIDKLNSTIKKEVDRIKIYNIGEIKESREELYSLKENYLEKRYLCYEYNRVDKRLEDILKELDNKKRNYSTIENQIIKEAKELSSLEEQFQIGEIAKKVLELRAFLKDGVPCLVCGSTTYNIEALEDIPTINIDKLTQQIEEKKKKLEKLKLEKIALKNKIASLREESIILKKEKRSIEEKLIEPTICSTIDNRLKEIDSKISALERYQKNKEALDKIELKKEKIKLYKNELKLIEESIKKLTSNRQNLFYGDIKEYKRDLNNQLNRLREQKYKSLREKDRMESNKREIEFIIKKQKKEKKSLQKSLAELKDRVDNLTLDKLNLEISNLEEEKSNKTKEIGKIEEILNRDAKISQEHKKILNHLKELQEELDTLETLNELIGSSDGAKFAKFAQTVTMDYLLTLANRHLKNLDDRYKIIQSGILNFEVVDSYQADETRPISTLSGGETFLVSLALALGLSDLAGKNINIETLFLDEGFGTLDSQSLETVLVGLDRLNSQGKMVGLISHIEAIKEAIPLKIEVKKSGGFGYLDSKYRV